MGSTAVATRRQQLLLLDPRDPTPSARELTDNPAVIHDFGAWSPDATRIAYAANERDEAHFDVYVQDVASGVRQCVYQGTIWSACRAFAPMARSWRCFMIVASATCRCCCSIVASGEAADSRVAEQLPERPLGERWSHLAGADRSRRQQLPAAVPARSGHRRHIRHLVMLPDATSRRGASHPMHGSLATIENDRGYAVLRVGPIDGDRPVVTGLPRGVVSDLAWSADGSALAFSVPRRRPSRRRSGCGATAPRASHGGRTATWIWRLRRSGTGVVAKLRRHARSRLVRVAARPATSRRLSSRHVGAWRAGRPDAAELPARHPDAARAGLRRAAAECARQFRLWPHLHREPTMSNGGSTA